MDNPKNFNTQILESMEFAFKIMILGNATQCQSEMNYEYEGKKYKIKAVINYQEIE